jgi:hypothetical protein
LKPCNPEGSEGLTTKFKWNIRRQDSSESSCLKHATAADAAVV